MSKYRVLPPELKAKVALAALRNDRTVNQIAAQYEVQPAQVSQWKRRVQMNVQHLFQDGRSKTPSNQECLINELYRQLGQLRFEMDNIKKKDEIDAA